MESRSFLPPFTYYLTLDLEHVPSIRLLSPPLPKFISSHLDRVSETQTVVLLRHEAAAFVNVSCPTQLNSTQPPHLLPSLNRISIKDKSTPAEVTDKMVRIRLAYQDLSGPH